MAFNNFSTLETFNSTSDFYNAYPALKEGWGENQFGPHHPPFGADIWDAKDTNGRVVKDEQVVTVAFSESESRRGDIEDASGMLVVWDRETGTVEVLSKKITVRDAIKKLK